MGARKLGVALRTGKPDGALNLSTGLNLFHAAFFFSLVKCVPLEIYSLPCSGCEVILQPLDIVKPEESRLVCKVLS
jgi:hypothetical protein